MNISRRGKAGWMDSLSDDVIVGAVGPQSQVLF